MPTATIERRQVFYSGRVQGVGFRWTVRHIAQGRAVQGFVKNMDDGRVQLLAEGTGQELDSFLTAIADRMDPNIHDFTVNREPATGEFSTFEIVH